MRRKEEKKGGAEGKKENGERRKEITTSKTGEQYRFLYSRELKKVGTHLTNFENIGRGDLYGKHITLD